MKYKQAMEIVARVAENVKAINGAEHSGDGWQRHLKLPVIEGRSLSVDAEYGSLSYWSRHDSGKNPTVDRIRIKCGHCYTVGGRHGKNVTRTFRVRDDDTLNEKGIEKALRELAEIQQREVVHRQEMTKREREHKDAQQRAKLTLRDVLQPIGYLREATDLPLERRLSNYGNVQAEGIDVDVQVRGTGSVELKLTGLSAEQALIALRRLGWTNDPVTTERTAC